MAVSYNIIIVSLSIRPTSCIALDVLHHWKQHVQVGLSDSEILVIYSADSQQLELT